MVAVNWYIENETYDEIRCLWIIYEPWRSRPSATHWSVCSNQWFYKQTAKAQISLHISAGWSRPLLSACPEASLLTLSYWTWIFPAFANSDDQIWLMKKPTDLDLHCLSLSMWICINNLEQEIWLAENWKWAWLLNLFSMAKVKCNVFIVYGHTSKTEHYNLKVFISLFKKRTGRVVKEAYLLIVLKLIFLFLHKNICHGYSSEAPHRGTYDDFPR